MLQFSVIIPCYHDEERLARLLTQLQQFPNHGVEIIVVDAADSSRCTEICREHDVLRIVSEPCRGQQSKLGATHAHGDVLWFLHADAQLTGDPWRAMTVAIDRGAVGGYFRFRFTAPRIWPALILEPAIALRCRFGIPYGDQGIFLLQSVYQQAGGHAPWPLFEEAPLIRAARRLGRFIALSEPILVDSRRWQRDGWWRRTWNNRLLALCFLCGASPRQLAARYHSKIHS